MIFNFFLDVPFDIRLADARQGFNEGRDFMKDFFLRHVQKNHVDDCFLYITDSSFKNVSVKKSNANQIVKIYSFEMLQIAFNVVFIDIMIFTVT